MSNKEEITCYKCGCEMIDYTEEIICGICLEPGCLACTYYCEECGYDVCEEHYDHCLNMCIDCSEKFLYGVHPDKE